MIRALGVLVLVCGCLGLAPLTPAHAATSPVHTLAVSGAGVATYPAFDTAVERYGITTTSATGGAVTVSATTDDSQGVVLVDGRPLTNGQTTVTGLDPGEEISVIFQDVGGTEVHSLVYLPAEFPHLSVVADSPSTSPGSVLLTFDQDDACSGFEVAVDRNGVPGHLAVVPAGEGLDLKPAPGGHYSLTRTPTTLPGRTGGLVAELDARFAPVRSLSTVGLQHTDIHDVILRPDGSRFLLAYEHNAQTGRDDAVIQEVDPTGAAVYTWNSPDHLDPDAETTSTPGTVDYAHINSIEELPDGDLLASFRNLSSVYKIAWSTRGSVHRGDVVWRLGGRHSDFTFPDDPDGGPCAQHSASMLGNGHVLVFDNGNAALGPNPALCVDPEDRTGPSIDRPRSRVAEYALDTQAGTARLAWSWAKSPRFAYFAGSARRLPGGNTLVDWAADTSAVATEVTPGGQVAWELKNDDGYFSYRAVKAVVPDAIDPAIAVGSPAAGASYSYGQRVTPDFSCTDRGGSSLHSCSGSRTALDTRTPGRHTYTVTALDGAGNRTTVNRSYTVGAAPASRPDALIRTAGGRWVGNNVYRSPTRQQVSQRIHRRGAQRTAVVRVQNDGDLTSRFTVRGTGGSRKFAISYYVGRSNISRAVRAGTWRPAVVPGRYVDVRVVVTRLRPARVGNEIRVQLTAVSATDARRRDAVVETVRATR